MRCVILKLMLDFSLSRQILTNLASMSQRAAKKLRTGKAEVDGSKEADERRRRGQKAAAKKYKRLRQELVSFFCFFCFVCLNLLYLRVDFGTPVRKIPELIKFVSRPLG